MCGILHAVDIWICLVNRIGLVSVLLVLDIKY